MPSNHSVIELSMRINGILNARYLQWVAYREQTGPAAVIAAMAFDEAAIERVKQFPVLLVDCHFSDVTWWRQRLTAATTSTAEDGKDERADVSRDVFTALWCLLDEGPEFHCLTGIAPQVAILWNHAGFNQLVDAARTARTQFVPRWSDVPVFWHRLRQAAQDDCGWDAVHLQALQLCGRRCTSAV